MLSHVCMHKDVSNNDKCIGGLDDFYCYFLMYAHHTLHGSVIMYSCV